MDELSSVFFMYCKYGNNINGGMNMLNNIVTERERIGSLYNVTLKMPGDEYFKIYEDLDHEAAEDILKQYLNYHGDDGRYSDVSIDYSKNTNIISINAKLHYEGNDHTKQYAIPPHLSKQK